MSAVGHRCTPLRLLLLVLVVTGVLGMHTLGHPSDTGHSFAEHGAVLVGPQPMGFGADAALMVVLNVDAHGAGMVMDPLNVCLAILVGGVLLLLAAMLARVRRSARPDHHVTSARPMAGRGPPGYPPFGLWLADLSVQRI